MEKMNKYLVEWYSIMNDEVYKSKIVEAENIDEVEYLDLLPETTRSNSYYQRIMHISDDERQIDYGSHSRYISIKTCK